MEKCQMSSQHCNKLFIVYWLVFPMTGINNPDARRFCKYDRTYLVMKTVQKFFKSCTHRFTWGLNNII